MIINLCKFFEVPVPKQSGLLDPTQLKSKDFIMSSKSQMLKKLYKVINTENGIDMA
jgi:hypothetical protein